MAVREFCTVTVESAFKTMKTTPVAGTDQISIRLDGSNAFTMRPVAQMTEVMYGGGFAVPAYTKSDQIELKGTLQTKLCYSQASLLLGWALTRVSGGTSPWTTTEPTGDLASCTVDHAIWDDSAATFKRKRYKGVKVAACKIDVSRDTRIATLSLDLVGSSFDGNTWDSTTDPDATAFPQPADSAYPTDAVLFRDSAGAFTVGSARTSYNSLSVNVQNAVDARFWENRFASIIRVLGRRSTLDAELMLKNTPDDRASFEQQSTLTASLAFTSGGHTLTLDYKGANQIVSLADDLQLDKVYTRKLSLANRYDGSAGNDLAFTYS